MPGEEIVAGQVTVVFDGDLTRLKGKVDEYNRMLDGIGKKGAHTFEPKLLIPSKQEVEEKLGKKNYELPVHIKITKSQVQTAWRDAINGQDFKLPVSLNQNSYRTLVADIRRRLDEERFEINVSARGGNLAPVNTIGVDALDRLRREQGGVPLRYNNPMNPNSTVYRDTVTGRIQPAYPKSNLPGVTFYPGQTMRDVLDQQSARDIQRLRYQQAWAQRIPATAGDPSGLFGSSAAYPQQLQIPGTVSASQQRRFPTSYYGGDVGINSPAGLRMKADWALGEIQNTWSQKVVPVFTGFAQRFTQNWEKNISRLEGEARRHFFAGMTLTSTFTLPAVFAGVGALRMESDFEKRMQHVPALTDIQSQDMPMLRKGVLGLSKELPTDARELADALYYVASTGNNAKDSLTILDKVSKGAAAGLGQTQVVADTVTTALKVYGDSAQHAGKYTDILTEAVRQGKGEAADYAPALGKTLAMAKIAGISFAEVAANMATATRAGLTANQAGTSLNMLLKNLEVPGTRASKVLAAMGTSADEVRKSLREKGLLATLGDLYERSSHNIANISKLVGSVTGLRNILSTAGAQGKAYVEILDQIEHSSGSTDRALKEMSKTFDFQWNRALNNGKAIVMELAHRVMPQLNSAMGTISDRMPRVIDNIAASWNSLPQPVQNAAKAVGAFLLLAGPLTHVVAVMKNVQAATMLLGGGFMARMPGMAFAAATAFALFGDKLGASAPAIDMATRAVLDLSLAMIALKAIRLGGSAITEIPALIGGLRNTVDSVKAIPGLVGAVTGARGVGSWMTMPFGAKGAATPLSAAALRAGVSGPGLAAGSAFGIGPMGTLAVSGPAAGLATIAAGGAAISWENYQRKVAEANNANMDFTAGLGQMEQAFKRLDSVAVAPSLLGGKDVRGGQDAHKLLGDLRGEFEKIGDLGDTDKMESFRAKVTRTISDIQRGKITLNLDDGALAYFIRQLQELQRQATKSSESIDGLGTTVRDVMELQKKSNEKGWFQGLAESLTEIYPSLQGTLNLLGQISNGFAHWEDKLPNGMTRTQVADRAKAGMSGILGLPGMWQAGVDAFEAGKDFLFPPPPGTQGYTVIDGIPRRTPAPARPVRPQGFVPYSPEEAARRGLARYQDVYNLDKMSQADTRKLYESLGTALKRGTATRDQQQFYPLVSQALQNKVGIQKKDEAVGPEIDTGADKARNRLANALRDQQIRQLDKVKSAWEQAASAVESMAAKTRAFGEETEAARTANEMHKLALQGVTQEYANQAIAVAQLYDRMKNLNDLRNSLRGPVYAYQEQLAKYGVLSDPNQKSLSALEGMFDFHNRARRIEGQVEDRATILYSQAKGNAQAIDDRVTAMRAAEPGTAFNSGGGVGVGGSVNGSPSYVASMLQYVGGTIGKQCGATLTEFFKRSGIHITATELANSPRYLVRPDARGNLPEGAMLHFPRGDHRPYAEGHYAWLHYMNERPYLLDSNFVGKPRVSNRIGLHPLLPRDLRLATKDGVLQAFLPPGVSANYPDSHPVHAAHDATWHPPMALPRRAPKISAAELLKGIEPDYDGSLGFFERQPKWLQAAWGKPVSIRDTHAESRMAMQATLFTEAGLRQLRRVASHYGQGAAIALVQAFRVQMNKQDWTTRGLAELFGSRDFGDQQRKARFLQAREGDPYADLDYQLQHGDILPQAYSDRKWQVNLGLQSDNDRQLRKEAMERRIRLGVQSTQDQMLRQPGRFNPSEFDIETQLEAFRLEQVDPENRNSDYNKTRNMPASLGGGAVAAMLQLQNTINEKREALQGGLLSQAKAGGRTELQQMQDQNEALRAELSLRNQGNRSEDELNDILSQRAAYLKVLHQMEDAHDPEAERKAQEATNEQATTNELEKQLRIKKQEYDIETQLSNRMGMANITQTANEAYGAGDAERYQAIERERLRQEAEALHHTDSSYDVAGHIKRGMEAFDQEARSDAVVEYRKSIEELDDRMRSLGDDTGLAAQGLALLHSKIGAYGPGEAHDRIAGLVGASNIEAQFGMRRDALSGLTDDQAQLAQMQASIRKRAFSNAYPGPDYADIRQSFNRGQDDQAQLSIDIQRAKNGYDLIQSRKEALQQAKNDLELSDASNAAEKEQIRLNQELNALALHHKEISEADLMLAKLYGQELVDQAAIAEARQRYQDLGMELRDSLVTHMKEAGTNIRGILRGVAQDVENILLDSVRKSIANKIVGTVMGDDWGAPDDGIGSLSKILHKRNRHPKAQDTKSLLGQAKTWDSIGPALGLAGINIDPAMGSLIHGFAGGDLNDMFGGLMGMMPNSAQDAVNASARDSAATATMNIVTAHMTAGHININAGNVAVNGGSGGHSSKDLLGGVLDMFGGGGSTNSVEQVVGKAGSLPASPYDLGF